MKILHLSDTHGKHHLLKNLPKTDIIVHSGDVSEDGTESEVLDFLNWFCALDYRYKFFVAGNHDFCLEGEQIEGLPENCHYLCNSGVEIEKIKFWGVPYFLSNELNGNTEQLMSNIPNKTDILITHRPPYGILDFDDNNNFGCVDLLQTVQKIRPKYHLFGHIHAAYGVEKSQYTTFINSSLVRKNKIVNEPFLLEI
ncbi:MAG: metallophosphatase domain-containing protein [Tannerella sp.]|jgi:Icc-related predicted phosphoesterase|nr:metallophosphatase domain-containing protein [Tannerella sp.]